MHHRGGGGGVGGQGGRYGGGAGGMGGQHQDTSFPSIPLSPKSLAKFGMGAYGDKFLGAGTAFVSNNYAKYFSSAKTRAYFDVTESYAYNKMKLILCPFLHRGSWARVPQHGGPGPGGYGGGGAYGEQMNGAQVNNGIPQNSSQFKPPREDINAPDLYLPLMGFWSYVLAASALQASNGTFTPELVATHFSWGGMVWCFESLLVWVALRTLSNSRVRVTAPWLDIASYTGYAFVLVTVQLVVKLLLGDGISAYALIGQTCWGSICSAVFIVKTVKRVIFSEARQHQHGINQMGASHNYVLLALAGSQFPVHWALGRVV